MLKIFRQKNVARKVLWVVTGIIVISFGFDVTPNKLITAIVTENGIYENKRYR